MVRFELRLRSVVFHKGHDGFLRGQPEPVLLCATFALGGGAQLLDKERLGLVVPGPFPCTAVTDTVFMKSRLPRDTRSVVLLCVAFEDDGGEDINWVLTAFDDPAAWSLRAADSPIAAPFALADLALAHWAAPPAGQQVVIAHRGVAVADRCTRDDWVGASAIVLDLAPRRTLACAPRIRAANGRNDWELDLAVTVR